MRRNLKLVGLHSFALLFLGLATTFLFGNPRVSYDGWQYISSAKSLQDGSLAQNYFWVRQPGYPLLIDFSFSLYNSLWSLILLQVIIFTSSFIFLIWQIRSYFSSLPESRFLYTTLVTYVFLLFFLGGYNLSVLPQSITSSFLMILTGVLLRFNRLFTFGKVSHNSRSFQLLTFPFLVVVGFSISPILSYLVLGLEMILIGFLIKGITRRDTFAKIRNIPFTYSLLLMSFLLSIFSLFIVDFAWSSFSQKYISSPNFNLDQLRDPFWGTGLLDYFVNLKGDPQLLHYIPASLLSLLMLTPNTGWNGLVIEKPSSFHSQNADVGFGLFSNNYPQCVDFPGEVLAVNNVYLRGLELEKSCALTHFDLPQYLYLPILVVWFVLCVYWLYRIVIYREFKLLVMSIVPIIYLMAYALLGGGIDRYGSSIYPIVVITMSLWLSSNWFLYQRAKVHINASTVSKGAAL
jgi:hypothetical protein